jgi:hypothetical protein
MESNHDDAMPVTRMWYMYAGGWAAYLLLLGFALQLEPLRQHGRVDWRAAQDVLWTIPQALLLIALWPLTGWMEARRMAPVPVFLFHVADAFAYAVASYALLWLMLGLARPLGWYVWPVLYCMMSYGVVAAIFHMVRMHHAARRQAAAIRQAHGLLVASELNALRSKLNPHFLFNTLHSIIALTRKNPDAAETALFQFSDMLRYVLDTEKSGSDRVTLDDELRFTRDYLELESLRLGQRLKVEWELDAAAGAWR